MFQDSIAPPVRGSGTNGRFVGCGHILIVGLLPHIPDLIHDPDAKYEGSDYSHETTSKQRVPGEQPVYDSYFRQDDGRDEEIQEPFEE